MPSGVCATIVKIKPFTLEDYARDQQSSDSEAYDTDSVTDRSDDWSETDQTSETDSDDDNDMILTNDDKSKTIELILSPIDNQMSTEKQVCVETNSSADQINANEDYVSTDNESELSDTQSSQSSDSQIELEFVSRVRNEMEKQFRRYINDDNGSHNCRTNHDHCT